MTFALSSRNLDSGRPPPSLRVQGPSKKGPAEAWLHLSTTPPRLPPLRSPRTALVRSLASTEEAALALIVAPPGYGKSMLLAEWSKQDPRPFVWATVDACELGPAQSTSSEWRTLPGAIRALRSRFAQFVVALDDAHTIEPELLSDVVQTALGELPPGATIAIASRHEPRLPTGRLRAHRQLAEVRGSELAMTSSEASLLLAAEGVSLEPDQLDDLVCRTEGWPAALYLAALALRGDPGALASFGGRHHLVFEYLRDEVLDHLPAELLTIAVRTSILDELSAPVCDAVLGKSGSAHALAALAQISPLLRPVDAGHESYRWHPLMREALRAELRRREPHLQAGLHRSACRCYRQRGDVQSAIDHAAAAGEPELAGGLLLKNLLSYITTGRTGEVRRWLSMFCPEQIADHEALAICAAVSCLVSGELGQAEHWTLVARAAIKRGPDGGHRHSFTAPLAVVEALIGRDGVAGMGQVAMDAAAVTPDDLGWRVFAMFLGGVSEHLRGDSVPAAGILDEAVRASGNLAPSAIALCLAQRAMIALEGEQWALAAEATDRAAIVLEEFELHEEPFSALVFAAAAASRAHEGRVDEAKRDRRRGMALVAGLGDFVPWYLAETRILLAYASLWIADIAAARASLADASRFARKSPDAVVFSRWFDRAWAYMDDLAESSLEGPSSLTIAELRVLRFLPSHRSFREIADHLGVSRNTVKTQAHAVYRKLGAASRSEAVDKAGYAGLLGQ